VGALEEAAWAFFPAWAAYIATVMAAPDAAPTAATKAIVVFDIIRAL
jgi:hypothetical protein